jgi:hypothetical protein
MASQQLDLVVLVLNKKEGLMVNGVVIGPKKLVLL